MRDFVGRDSSVGIATRYGLGGPGIESRWGARLSAPVQTDLGPTQLPTQRIPGISPGVKRPGRDADHPPSSSAEVKGMYVTKKQLDVHFFLINLVQLYYPLRQRFSKCGPRTTSGPRVLPLRSY